MSKLTKTAPLLIVFAAFLWGLDGILRRSLFSLPPIIIVFYEHLIGSIIIAPFIFPDLKLARFKQKDLLALLGISLLSGLVGTLAFTTALLKTQFIPFSVVFLVQKLQPIFAIAAAAALLKEKITRPFLTWSLLALISAYFVTFPGGAVNFQTGSQTALAALFALTAAIAWGSSTALSRYALQKHPHSLVAGLRFILTTVLALVAVFVFGQSASLTAPSFNQLGTLTLIAFSTGMVALWIYYRGLKFTQAKISTILELTFPLTAVIIDIFLYKTFLAPSQYLAALVLVFAIFRVSRLNEK